MDLEQILKTAVRGGASDIILKTEAIPRFRFNGQLVDLSGAVTITSDIMANWISTLVPNHLRSKLEKGMDLDFSYQSTKGNRFRVNLFRQRQKYGIVMRIINNHIRTVEELLLPAVINSFAEERRGLLLVTGSTGSGKSTTLAAIIEKINTSKPAHIITIEDPIEFMFKDKKSTINQREIGSDVDTFETALRSALRQNPDVIFVGELRDKQTTETALMAAETGHFVLSTLHTADAVEAITRILSYFSPHQHTMIRSMLTQTLKGVISQRLLPKADNKGMVPATEIMVANALIAEEIHEGKNLNILKDAIKKSKETYGMQSFDQSLLTLYQRGIITKKTALEEASNQKDFELNLRGVTS